MNTKRLIILTSALLFTAGVSAQAVASLQADTIALGDQTTLSIRNALNYPSAEMLSQDGIVALGQTFDTATRTQYTVVTSFEPGTHYLRLSPDDSLPLVVTDVEVDTAAMEPRDIMPIERIPYSFWEIFRWVLLVLAVAAVAFGVWWLMKHRKQVQQILGMGEPVDNRTPEERALQSLDELRAEKVWQSGKVKEYHTRLTDIVRSFIEESTGIRATEMTSEDCVNAFTMECAGKDVATTITQSHIDTLKDIFAIADLVKFAKSEPLPHEHERSMDNAVMLVKALWQAVKPKEEEVKDA